MALTFDPTDPDHLSPDQRLDELTAILAEGVRRLLSLRAAPAESPAPEIPPESTPNGLDVCGETRLHVPRG